MKTPWKLLRYLPQAARFLREGRLPELLHALRDKRTPQGQRFAVFREDLQLLRALSLAWFKGEYRQISRQALLTIVAALLYVIAPLDAIPDWLVGLGFDGQVGQRLRREAFAAAAGVHVILAGDHPRPVFQAGEAVFNRQEQLGRR